MSIMAVHVDLTSIMHLLSVDSGTIVREISQGWLQLSLEITIIRTSFELPRTN